MTSHFFDDDTVLWQVSLSVCPWRLQFLNTVDKQVHNMVSALKMYKTQVLVDQFNKLYEVLLKNK
jgi:hypothetical protein